MFTVDRVNYAQWLHVNVHNTEIFCSLTATLLPHLHEEVVKRMMVHVADAVEKTLKWVMFPTVSSNCCSHSTCEGTFGKILTARLFFKALGLPHNIDPRVFSGPRTKTA